MSVYDFNHNEHLTANQIGRGASNGTQPKYQADNDYLNRGFSSTHHSDMSVQLTRPTSKTAMLVRQRRAMMEQLSCFLCKGYLIDATTIDECMDSFCKSCIVIYLRSHNNCPKCGTLIHKTNPLSTIRSDKVLQDIVYKLVPGLYDDEMKRRREFYKSIYGMSSDESDEDGSSCSFNGRFSNLTSEQYGVISHPKPFYKPTDSIDLSIEPQTRGENTAIYYDNKRQSIVTCFTGNLQQQQQQPPSGSLFSSVDSQQFKTYLRCPAKLTALQLKKFIAAKFNISRDDTIHLLYLNESLKDVYSLIDIAYIYDWRGIEHMRLFYIIERDLSKMVILPEDTLGGQSRKTKLCQSVGTSTQTVKRVCIDPEPKYYEEKKSNVIPTNTSGRSMRPRNDASVSPLNKIVSSYVKQAPILRSYSSTRDGTSMAQQNYVNGISSKESVTLSEATTETYHRNLASNSVNQSTGVAYHNTTKETRSTRKVSAESTAGCIPKININLNSLDQISNSGQQQYQSATNTYRGINAERCQQEITRHARQVMPCVRKGYLPISNSGTVPSQSSLVSLSNFTGTQLSSSARSVSCSPAAPISNNHQTSSGTPLKPEIKPDVTTNQTIRTTQSAQGLAFSYVTERGITIVRRFNSRDQASTSIAPSPITNSRINSVQGSQATSTSSSSSQRGNISSERTPVSSQLPAGANRSSAGTSGGTETSNYSSSHDIISARHHVKVKPVYKTLVDPTKLRSPNFKKLGYTARH